MFTNFTDNPMLEENLVESKENAALTKQKERKNVKLYENSFNLLASYAKLKNLTRDEAIIELIHSVEKSMTEDEKGAFNYIKKQHEK